MAIINNNVQNVQFLRNQTIFVDKTAASTALESNKGLASDGSALLARYYGEGNVIKTLVGFVAVSGNDKYLTIIDVEGSEADVEALRQQMENTFGTGVTSANTATAQLAALSGNTASTSAETSVEGAKRYTEDLISTLDGGITAETGSYIVSVSEVDGKVSGTTAALPTVDDTAVAKKFVIEVDQTNGEISVSRGEITSSAQTIVLTDNADGGVNFEVNIDNDTIVQDETSKVLKVASAALTQYIGDGKTIEISAADANNNKTVSTLLTLSSVTPSSTTVKEEYALKNASGETIGTTIKIYKDSSLVSITYITDPSDAHYQNLEYVYVDNSGNTQTEYVDMSTLVLEAEFASGVTADASGMVHGVVDPTSESFLTVGANGFKISGVSGLVTNAIEALDAYVSGNSTHVTVGVEEVNGVITAVTVSEDNIASADDLAELSGKTITELTSENGSIDISDGTIADDGTMSFDLITDASKIKMSGFTSTDALSGITSSSSITEAFEEVDRVITENEQTTASALTDLNTRLETVSGDVDTIESQYISGITVNGSGATVTSNVAALTIVSAPATGTDSSPIDVATSNNGGITLTIQNIDCGYYDGTV